MDKAGSREGSAGRGTAALDHTTSNRVAFFRPDPPSACYPPPMPHPPRSCAHPVLQVLLAGPLALASACGTVNSARPLEPGQHQVGVTLGGPLLTVGGATLPMPNVVAQGRSGVAMVADRPLDVDYGLNLTAAAFGIVAVHGGASWLALDQDGGIPALSLSNRLWVADNHLDFTKGSGTRALHAVDQIELTASWDTSPALLYGGAAQYLDLREPSLLLTPFLGAAWHLGKGWDLQTELRHYSINRPNPQGSVNWVTWGPGAVGATLSVSKRMGGVQ